MGSEKITTRSTHAVNTLLKMIENWKKQLNNGNLHGPFKSFWHEQSQFTIDKTESAWFF